jgi:RNA polymerase sigma factor (TIGR02999 family)
MRLAGHQRFENRRHFFAAAGEAMRRVLVDHARRKLSAKRGGSAQRLPLSDMAASDADDRLLALDEALTQLAGDDPLLARVVELHHFAGLPHDQVAAVLDTTVYDVRQKWTYARAWLKAAVQDF